MKSKQTGNKNQPADKSPSLRNEAIPTGISAQPPVSELPKTRRGMKEFLIRYRIVILVTGAVIAGFAAWVALAFWRDNTWEGQQEKTFYVSRGQTFAAIVDSLEVDEIIRSKALFVFVAKLSGGISRLQVAKYIFKNGISNADLYHELRSGKGSSKIAVTIPEGLRSRQQARLFSRSLGLDSTKFVGLAHDEDFVRSFGIDAPDLEGYLFPDTYSFAWQVDEKEVIRKMVEEFKRFYTDSLQERAKAFHWNTSQVLAMASIVEGETRVVDERPIIAGIYHNRLRRGMRLEADPTIQFILENGPRRVLYADLHIDSPYNTYIYTGLPPGPVNNPGRASILASLYPVNAGYLYFVANGAGGHSFSRTFEEHERHVRMFRRVRARQHAAMLKQVEGKSRGQY